MILISATFQADVKKANKVLEEKIMRCPKAQDHLCWGGCSATKMIEARWFNWKGCGVEHPLGRIRNHHLVANATWSHHFAKEYPLDIIQQNEKKVKVLVKGKLTQMIWKDKYWCEKDYPSQFDSLSKTEWEEYRLNTIKMGEIKVKTLQMGGR